MSELYTYRLYGVTLRAAEEMPLPRVPGEVWAQAGMRLEARRVEPAQLPGRPEGAEQIHSGLTLPGGTELRIERAGDRLWIDDAGWSVLLDLDEQIALCAPRAGEASGAAACGPLHFLLGRLVVPLYALLACEAAIGLHASAVARDGVAWIFAAYSGVGKSTTAHALIERGALPVADDFAVIDISRGALLPAATGLRLWGDPESVASEQRREVYDGYGKYWHRWSAPEALVDPLPVAGVVILERDEDAPTAGVLGELRGARRMSELLRYAFDLTRPSFAWRRRRFRNAAALASSAPVCHLRFAPDPSGEPAHISTLTAWMEETR